MTQHTPAHEPPASLLAPLARGLLRRAPDILSMSIIDARGLALWSSDDFLLAEDHALIAEVIEESHDVREPGCGLWWESADTARARCALALHEGDEFCGVVLVVFSGLTIDDEGRVERVDMLAPLLPVLAKAVRSLDVATAASDASPASSDTTIISQLRFVN